MLWFFLFVINTCSPHVKQLFSTPHSLIMSYPHFNQLHSMFHHLASFHFDHTYVYLLLSKHVFHTCFTHAFCFTIITYYKSYLRDSTIAGKCQIWYPGSSAWPLDQQHPGISFDSFLHCHSTSFTLYPYYCIHDTLWMLEISWNRKEVALLSNVLQLALPGLEGFVQEERYVILSGKMG